MANILNFAQKALIVNKEGKILVLKNPDSSKYKPGMLHLPGGRIKFGEDLEDHIKREVFEETGIRIKPLYPLSVVSWIVNEGDDTRKELKGNNLHVIAIIRYCKYISGRLNYSSNVDDENIELAFWEEPSKLLKNPNFDRQAIPALKTTIKLKRSR